MRWTRVRYLVGDRAGSPVGREDVADGSAAEGAGADRLDGERCGEEPLAGTARARFSAFCASLPPALEGRKYYEPKERGFEKEIKRRLDGWEEIKKKRRS